MHSSLIVKASLAGLVILASLAPMSAAQDSDKCKIECYPNSRMMNGKGAQSRGGDNCRWILRTDGKPARLCDHIKCRKVCPGGQQPSDLDNSGAASDPMRVEQTLENDSPISGNEPMGIMRHLHGSKMSRAQVPGVAGGRLAPSSSSSSSSSSVSHGGRRMAPTLPPSSGYDENDTPPPISRFLDISPDE